MSSAFFSYWTCDPWTGQVFPCAWDQHDLPPPFRKTNWRPAALSSSGIAAGTPLCQQGGKKIAPHRAARTQTSYLLSSQKVESLLLLCPSAVSNSPEPQSSQQQLSPRIFTSSSQCESSSIPLPLFALSDMHKVQFYRRVPLFGRVLQPPLCSPLSNRALRIHFVGLSLLCTHTTGSSLHQRVFMKDSKKKKKRSPCCLQERPSKLQSPEFQGDVRHSVDTPEAAKSTCLAWRGGKSWGAAEKKGWGRTSRKTTVMTVITGRCGCLLGDAGNKTDKQGWEVDFSSWILIMYKSRVSILNRSAQSPQCTKKKKQLHFPFVIK